MKNLRVYVGPTLVGALAAKFRQAGIDVTCEGTEHLYCSYEPRRIQYRGSIDPRIDFRCLLLVQFGTCFGLQAKDIEVLEPLHTHAQCDNSCEVMA